VASRQVLVTWDPSVTDRFWLVREYLPEIAAADAGLATMAAITACLDVVAVEPLLVPADCRDAFLGAHWRRPEAYLDPAVRAANSAMALLPAEVVEPAMAHLADDLADGSWAARHAHLLDLDELDLGYRLVIAHTPPNSG